MTKETLYRGKDLKDFLYKDSKLGLDSKCLRWDTKEHEVETWVESAFLNRLLKTSPHLFEEVKNRKAK